MDQEYIEETKKEQKLMTELAKRSGKSRTYDPDWNWDPCSRDRKMVRVIRWSSCEECCGTYTYYPVSETESSETYKGDIVLVGHGRPYGEVIWGNDEEPSCPYVGTDGFVHNMPKTSDLISQ